ncbi:MAG: Hpt domain-containing protein [Eubacteriales bacterium]|nr:Hpt domain-containing protein [Eubacteriales bacterium]
MTTEACYRAMGADYSEVIRRFATEERVRRFLVKVPDDPNYRTLAGALEAQDFETAFRAAHSLKGVCLNLGLGRLAESSAALTEALRSGAPSPDYAALFERLRQDYERTIESIGALDPA